MKLVISAVNLVEGGTLTVLREVVRAAADHFPDWEIIVAVHRPGTVSDSRVTEVPFPAAKSSWLRRLWLEWVTFRSLSLQWRADVWLSLHDITPRVVAGQQYVYCHNPSPFCTAHIPLEHLDRKFQLFRRFYGSLYRCFIHRNSAVIVQQQWLRKEFMRRYSVSRVIVAHPVAARSEPAALATRLPRRFVYPAFPRVFKNFELLGDSVTLLETDPAWDGEVVITIDGSENAYAAQMRARFGALRTLRFIGLQPPEAMDALYRSADAIVFPSLLETWGLPLTEARARGLPILAADLPYAHESVGHCGNVCFFDPADAPALADLMLNLHRGNKTFGTADPSPPPAPFARDWKELLELLLAPASRREAFPAKDQGS